MGHGSRRREGRKKWDAGSSSPPLSIGVLTFQRGQAQPKKFTSWDDGASPAAEGAGRKETRDAPSAVK